jgi:crotonobetainyl-CoA:carnitine CoA-transferase CaiB-like acyl-CoA transferase
LFVAVVTDTQWSVFCQSFSLNDLQADARLRTNGQRVKERGWLIPRLAESLRRFTQSALTERLEAIGLPFAPIAKPWDLLEDPHLKASGGLLETRIDGRSIHVPALPLELGGERLAKRRDPPAIGQDGRELLTSLGYASDAIEALAAQGIIRLA